MGTFLLSIFLGVCGIASFWVAITFLRRGEATVMGGPFTRLGHPIRYWAYTVWLLLLSFLLLLLAAVPASR